jgi:hypothetical protein
MMTNNDVGDLVAESFNALVVNLEGGGLSGH